MKSRITIILSGFVLLVFVISACTKISDKREMAITTDEIIADNSQITAKGTLIDLGDNEIISYGFCWSTSSLPTITENVLAFNNPPQTGAYSGLIYNVLPNNLYHVRAYIDDGEKIVYGEDLTFIPLTDSLLITTDHVTYLSSTSVNVQGTVNKVGSLLLQDFGLYWSEVTSPSSPVNTISLGNLSRDTVFNSTLSNLITTKPYYARTFVRIDNTQTLLGNVLTFSIPDLVVTTDTVQFSGSTAYLFGTIVSLGIPAVTEHGFCWAVSTSYPSVNNNKIILGPAIQTGSFNGNLTGLSTGTTYYYRAYATDGTYIKYGSIKHFTF